MVRARANKSLAFVCLLLLAAAGCTTTFERRYDEAERLRVEAAAVGAEWLNTEKLLHSAREAAEQGNEEDALALVDEAKFQAEAAIRQAEYEATAWRDRVVR